MKKWWIVLAAVVMVFTLGTAVYASAAGDGMFQQMLPFMKQMHPEMSEQQLLQMHETCEANGGMSGKMHSDMMKQFGTNP